MKKILNDTSVNESFKVLVNQEEQYSIWPEHLPVPAGWRGVGVMGEKQKCLDYVKETWTDMRPLSLRKQMATHEAASAKAAR